MYLRRVLEDNNEAQVEQGVVTIKFYDGNSMSMTPLLWLIYAICAQLGDLFCLILATFKFGVVLLSFFP